MNTYDIIKQLQTEIEELESMRPLIASARDTELDAFKRRLDELQDSPVMRICAAEARAEAAQQRLNGLAAEDRRNKETLSERQRLSAEIAV